MVYTKQLEEDEESVGFSYHVMTQNEKDVSSQIKVDEEIEDAFWCYHISTTTMILKRKKMLEILHRNLKKE